MRYDIRDTKGKFTKINWDNVEKGKPMIDHDTHEPVQAPETEPVNLPVLQEEEPVIRGTMNKLADGLVKLSSYGRKIDDLEARITTLMTAIENAEQRVKEANAERDQARKERDEAVEQAHMARAAYDTVNKAHRDEATAHAATKAEFSNLSMAHETLKGEHSFRGDEITRINNLLDIARTERDTWRTNSETERTTREAAEFKVLEFEEVKEKLATTAQALDICAAQTADWKAKATTAETDLLTAKLELDGLHHKVNGLEDSNKTLAESNNRLVLRLENARRSLD